MSTFKKVILVLGIEEVKETEAEELSGDTKVLTKRVDVMRPEKKNVINVSKPKKYF